MLHLLAVVVFVIAYSYKFLASVTAEEDSETESSDSSQSSESPIFRKRRKTFAYLKFRFYNVRKATPWEMDIGKERKSASKYKFLPQNELW